MENGENKSLTENLKWKLAHEQDVAHFRTYLEEK
jgi:hypothetical protein